MPLETPPTPAYGPDTFTDLAELARILMANDEFLLENAGAGGGDTTAIEDGGRLGPHVGGVSDCNDALDTGYYQASGAANTPPTSGSYLIEVVRITSGTTTQTATRFPSTDVAFDEEWTRRRANGVWTPWRVRYMGRTAFTPSWYGSGKYRGTVLTSIMSVADGVGTVELVMEFGADGSYGDLILDNPLAAYTSGPGSTGAVACAGRFTSAGTSSVGTPSGLISANGALLYARPLVVSGSNVVAAQFSSSVPGGVTATGQITATWQFVL